MISPLEFVGGPAHLAPGQLGLCRPHLTRAGLVPGVRFIVGVVSTAVLGLSVWGVSATTVAAAATYPLTCFAVDVSGSNLAASGGEPPSDPGPVFVRQQVVELFSQVLADLGEAAGQQIGVVTFGTGPGVQIGPLGVSASATRSELAAELPSALRPSSAEAAWTDWVAGVSGCEQMFIRSGDSRGMVALLTDGFPQGPAGGPAPQLAKIAPIARQLWANNITIQPVLYGAGANQQGAARLAMSQLATLGHGHLVLAATPLDMLRAALSLASLSAGLPLGGSEVLVNGSTTVPIDVGSQVAEGVMVILRNSSQLQISVDDPGGKALMTSAAGTPGLGLVVPLVRPMAGSYQARANGQGSVFAAELLRYAAVTVPSLNPLASAGSGPTKVATGARPGTRSNTWLLGAVLGLAALAIVGLLAWIIAKRRRPRGTLVVWWGTLSCLLDPADFNVANYRGSVRLEDLFHYGEPTGWSVSWTRHAPMAFGPDGSVLRLTPGDTRTMPTVPPATLTWFPGGTDTSLSNEPPGRPASAMP